MKIIEVLWYEGDDEPGKNVVRVYSSKFRLCRDNYLELITADLCPGLGDKTKERLHPLGQRILSRLYAPGIFSVEFTAQYMLTVSMFAMVSGHFTWPSIHEQVKSALKAAFAADFPEATVIFTQIPHPKVGADAPDMTADPDEPQQAGQVEDLEALYALGDPAPPDDPEPRGEAPAVPDPTDP